MNTPSEALQKVIDHAGSQVALAKALNQSRQTINSWKTRGVPLVQAIRIEKLYRRKTGVKAIDLRPDAFGG